jgi:hypothetical protein
MSTSISIIGFAGKKSPDFQKHLKAVKFCIENELSFPKETSRFFKGKVGGEDLENIRTESILRHIENGIEIPLKIGGDEWRQEINISEIPKEVETLIFMLS